MSAPRTSFLVHLGRETDAQTPSREDDHLFLTASIEGETQALPLSRIDARLREILLGELGADILAGRSLSWEAYRPGERQSGSWLMDYLGASPEALGSFPVVPELAEEEGAPAPWGTTGPT